MQQNDFEVIQQSIIRKYIKLNVLDFSFNTLLEISGYATKTSFNVNADSDLRRNCAVSLVVNDGSIDVSSGSPIWLDKYIQIFVGYENIHNGELQWYNQGIYLINEPSWVYDGATNELSFQGVDLMAKLTGLRNGQLEGIQTVIPQGTNVKSAIISTLGLAGFTNYIVDECRNIDGTIQDVPYDIQIAQGGTVFDILKALRDILPNYQVYFDVDGVFHYNPIPSDDNAPILINDEIFVNILLSENVSTSFQNVKNYIEVYGKTHDVAYYSSSTTYSGTTLTLALSGLTTPIPDYTTIGFTTPNTSPIGAIKIHISGGSTYDLVNSNGEGIMALTANKYYVIQFQSASSNFLLLGGLQASAIAYDDDSDSPFQVSKIGKIRQVLVGGDYENIMSDELAQERADIELYWRCRLNDNITLNTIPIPFLEVNTVIEHKGKKYIIKSFNAEYGNSNAMQITAMSFYPYYRHYLPYAFNQLVNNGNFKTTTGWAVTRGTMAVSSNTLTYTITNAGSGNQNRLYTSVDFIAGHKYFAIATVNTSASKTLRFFAMTPTTVSFPFNTTLSANEWITIADINTVNYNDTQFGIYCQNNNTNGDTLQVQNMMLIDLTAMYGKGKEPPDTLTVINDCALIGHPLSVYQERTI